MEFFDSVKEAVKMLLNGDFSVGSIMLLSGCLLLLIIIIPFLTSFGRFKKQRETLFEDLRRN